MTSLKNEIVWRRWINQSLREAGWAPLLVFAVHVIALGAFDAYSRIAHLDLFMHFIGGAVMAFFLHRTSINASLIGVIGTTPSNHAPAVSVHGYMCRCPILGVC